MSISDKHADEIVTHRLECKPLIEPLKAALTTAEAQRDALAEALRGGKDLIDVARMPDIEHVADAHNRAVKQIRAALAALEGKP